MPWESVGSISIGQLPHDREMIIFCCEKAIACLKKSVGKPPEGCELDIMWHEHDLGDYPTIGVHWDYPQTDVPWEYVNECEEALTTLDKEEFWAECQLEIESMSAEKGENAMPVENSLAKRYGLEHLLSDPVKLHDELTKILSREKSGAAAEISNEASDSNPWLIRLQSRMTKIDTSKLSPEAQELLKDPAFLEAISVVMPEGSVTHVDACRKTDLINKWRGWIANAVLFAGSLLVYSILHNPSKITVREFGGIVTMVDVGTTSLNAIGVSVVTGCIFYLIRKG